MSHDALKTKVFQCGASGLKVEGPGSDSAGFQLQPGLLLEYETRAEMNESALGETNLMEQPGCPAGIMEIIGTKEHRM